MRKCPSISLPDADRVALEANHACHSDYVLAWKRTQAFLLLDAKEDPETICRMFNMDATVLTEWIRAYSAEGFASFGLKDYSEVSISLSAEQRAETKAICRRPKVDNPVWKRAQAINLLDAKEDPKTICRTLDIDLTVLTEWARAYSADGLASLSLKDYSQASISLSDDQRVEIKSICRRRKVDALSWKRARAIGLLDAGVDPETICQILDIGRTVLTEWRRAFSVEGVAFFGLKDYSQREGHLTVAQEEALKKHFTEHPPLKTGQICAYILAEYGQKFSASGAAKLMKRLGFVYKKPVALKTQADEEAQQAYIDMYEGLMNSLLPNENVLFLDAVHPEYQSRPAHGWFPKDQKTAIKTTSGRKRLNIHGALDLETFKFIFVEGERINAETTRQLLEEIEKAFPTMVVINIILDNARYHHAKLLLPRLESPERRVKLHFLPPYAPHLNPIERLWAVMHMWVTHNQYYATYDEFTVEILKFFRESLPENWKEIRDIVSDNFCVFSTSQYKIIGEKSTRPDGQARSA